MKWARTVRGYQYSTAPCPQSYPANFDMMLLGDHAGSLRLCTSLIESFWRITELLWSFACLLRPFSIFLKWVFLRFLYVCFCITVVTILLLGGSWNVTIYVVDSAWFWLECLKRYVDTCELTFQTKWIKYPEKFSPQCQKLANIGLKMYFMCFYSICPGASLTRAGEWEIWYVSGRLLDSPHELAWMYNTGRFTASFPARGW